MSNFEKTLVNEIEAIQKGFMPRWYCNHGFAIGACVLTAISAIIAGQAVANGKGVINGDWKATCQTIAWISGFASLCSAIPTLIGLPKSVVDRKICLGRLRNLILDLRDGEIESKMLHQRHKEIVNDHPSCFTNISVNIAK